MSRSPRSKGFVPLAARAARLNREAETQAQSLKQQLKQQLRQVYQQRDFLLDEARSDTLDRRIAELNVLASKLSEMTGMSEEQLARIPAEDFVELQRRVREYLSGALSDASAVVDRALADGPSLEELKRKAGQLSAQVDVFHRRREPRAVEEARPSCGESLLAGLRYVFCCGSSKGGDGVYHELTDDAEDRLSTHAVMKKGAGPAR